MKQTRPPKAILAGLAMIIVGGLGLAILAPAMLGADFGVQPVLADSATDASGAATGATAGAAASTSTSTGGQTSTKLSTPSPIGNVSPNTIIGRVIKGFVGAVGVVALIMFIYAGFLMMTAGGNSQQVDKGKKTMIWATIGLIGVFLSYAAVAAVLKALGAS